MKEAVLLAIIKKIVDEKIVSLPMPVARQGHRGPQGEPGIPGPNGKDFVYEDHRDFIESRLSKIVDVATELTPERIELLKGPKGDIGPEGQAGKDFDFSEVETTLHNWIKEATAIATELTPERVEILRGYRGRDGRDGKDGKDFDLCEVEQKLRQWIKDSALKLSDLTESEIESLRGPSGSDGKSITFEDVKEQLLGWVKEYSLSFQDLTESEIESLRGPRGQRGKPGKGFVFEEHREYFDSLKPKFSDFTDEERGTLKLRFSDLTDEERDLLRLKFDALTLEQKMELRGPRGQRGKQGPQGQQGEKGATGLKGDKGDIGLKGLPGPVGVMGIAGRNGTDGRDGQDGNDGATVIDVVVDQTKNEIEFIFVLSDGRRIRTRSVKIPSGGTQFIGVVGGGSGGGSGTAFNYFFGSGIPDDFDGNDGDVYQNLDNGNQYKKILGAWELQANLIGPDGPAGPAGSQYYFGAGLPDDSFAVDGDVSQDTDTGDQYKKISGTWILQDNLTGPQGPPGSGGGQDLLVDIDCDSDVYIGAAVRMDATAIVELTMSEWTTLSDLPMLTATTYDVLAVNALADAYENSNVIGIVEDKSAPDKCTIRVSGISAEIFLGLDIFQEYYLSDVYPGKIVSLPFAPTNPGTILVRLGQPFSPAQFFYQRGDRIVRGA